MLIGDNRWIRHTVGYSERGGSECKRKSFKHEFCPDWIPKTFTALSGVHNHYVIFNIGYTFVARPAFMTIPGFLKISGYVRMSHKPHSPLHRQKEQKVH